MLKQDGYGRGEFIADPLVTTAIWLRWIMHMGKMGAAMFERSQRVNAKLHQQLQTSIAFTLKSTLAQPSLNPNAPQRRAKGTFTQRLAFFENGD